MKKVVIALVVMIAAVSISNAQVFVGGGLGLDFSLGKNKQSPFCFSISPKVGFYQNNDFAFGAELDLAYGKSFYSNYEYITTLFGADVFLRRKLVGVENFSLFLEGSVGAAMVIIVLS